MKIDDMTTDEIQFPEPGMYHGSQPEPEEVKSCSTCHWTFNEWEPGVGHPCRNCENFSNYQKKGE